MAHETTRLWLPVGGAARLFSLSDAPDFAWGIVIATEPERARPESLKRRGQLSAMLTHADGIAWPDWKGERLATETLAIGGTVYLTFDSLAYIMTRKKRMEGGGR